MNPPSIAEFTVFLQSVAGISTAYLPPTSPAITSAFNQALNIVNDDMACLAYQQGSWSVYELAVYNLATHNIIEFATDQTYPISGVSWAAGIVTVTTTSANAILVGDQLAVSGISPNTYNNPQAIAASVLSDTQFTYGLAPNPGPGTPGASATASELFFINARRNFKMTSFVPGVVASSADLSTSAGIDNPDFLKGLQLSDLQYMKTPFGRQYLSLAMKYGPTIWGMS